jgi:hypothetical protein
VCSWRIVLGMSITKQFIQSMLTIMAGIFFMLVVFKEIQ